MYELQVWCTNHCTQVCCIIKISNTTTLDVLYILLIDCVVLYLKCMPLKAVLQTPPISRNIMLSLYYNLLFNQYSHRYPSRETSPRTTRVNIVVLLLTLSNIQVDDPVHITPNLVSTSLNQSLITHSLSLSNTRYLSFITISGFVFPFCYKVPRLSMEYCFNS